MYLPYHFDQGQHCFFFLNSVKTEKKIYSLAKERDATNKNIEYYTHISGAR